VIARTVTLNVQLVLNQKIEHSAIFVNLLQINFYIVERHLLTVVISHARIVPEEMDLLCVIHVMMDQL
jgi:hypothetical protein